MSTYIPWSKGKKHYVENNDEEQINQRMEKNKEENAGSCIDVKPIKKYSNWNNSIGAACWLK